ncbi:MAG: hypothetical protein ACFFCW_30970 [Candidatus Hodarchaeota archaeon]
MGGQKKNEIIVSAPRKSGQKPTEKAKKPRAEAIEEERIEILETSQRVGKAFCGLTIGAGALLLFFSFYLIITGPLTGSLEGKLLFIAMLTFLSIVNMASGLLLMGRS